MTKRQLIDEITVINRSAKPSFLARFDTLDLDEYLRHLQQAGTSRISGDWTKYSHYFSQSADTQAKQPLVLEGATISITAIQETPATQAQCPGAYEEEVAAEPAEPAEIIEQAALPQEDFCDEIELDEPELDEPELDQPQPESTPEAQPQESPARRVAPAMATWLF